jgi:hypothetical protein
MNLKETEHGESHPVKAMTIFQGNEEHNQHSRKNGYFHDEPSCFAPYRITPAIIVSHAVCGRDKLQYDENNNPQDGHNP